jgi:type II secretory pathway component GspD/PulD (secretin)
MKIAKQAAIACMAVALASIALAQSESASSVSSGGVPMLQLIETVSKKSSKHFIVDPRVTGNVTLIGIDPSKITYAQLLSVLQVSGYSRRGIWFGSRPMRWRERCRLHSSEPVTRGPMPRW